MQKDSWLLLAISCSVSVVSSVVIGAIVTAVAIGYCNHHIDRRLEFVDALLEQQIDLVRGLAATDKWDD